MVVLQLYDEVPIKLQKHVQSVKDFADRMNVEYVVVGSDEWWKEYKYMETPSDIVRLEILSEDTDILYVDWDVYLSKDFDYHCFGPKPMFGADQLSLIWNGKEQDLFKKWLVIYHKMMENYSENFTERGRLFKISRNNLRRDALRFEKKTYKHEIYHKNKDVL